MFYLGKPSARTTGALMAGLINPQLEIARARAAGLTQAYDPLYGQYYQTPSFTELSPLRRRDYLRWLAEGRKFRAPVGAFWKMFLSGIEHRILVDRHSPDERVSAQVRTELDHILSELWRMAETQGDEYWDAVGPLLDLLNILRLSGKLYQHPSIPALPRLRPISGFVRLGLSQCASDGEPVPDHLARVWLKAAGTNFRTAAKRCPEEFATLFAHRYYERAGGGVKLRTTQAKYAFAYAPINSGLNSRGSVTFNFGQVKEVFLDDDTLRWLQDLADEVARELEPYSKFLGSARDDNTEPVVVQGSTLLLPLVLWPKEAQQELIRLQQAAATQPVCAQWDKLLASIDSNPPPGRASAVALARALENVGVGMEPDVLAGAKAPATHDRVLLFDARQALRGTAIRAGAYHATYGRILQLLAFVALVDGPLRPAEQQLLYQTIERGAASGMVDEVRLHARLRLYEAAPPTLAGLKGKFAQSDNASQALARLSIELACCDGDASPEEVKALEKVFPLLGLNTQDLYDRLHTLSAGGSLAVLTDEAGTSNGVQLDPVRVAALQAETQQVGALLGAIFSDDSEKDEGLPEAVHPHLAPVPSPVLAVGKTGQVVKQDHLARQALLPGLDVGHAALAARLLARPEWTRAELQELASSLDLMLDGALEHLNDACFDAHDLPLTEGEDPVLVNAEAVALLRARDKHAFTPV